METGVHSNSKGNENRMGMIYRDGKE